MSLVVTERAARKILDSARQSGYSTADIRIAAKRQSDGAIEYAMGFDERQKDDVDVRWHGVNVMVGPTSTELLTGATLDFVEIEKGRFEFIFLNPNDPNYSPPDED